MSRKNGTATAELPATPLITVSPGPRNARTDPSSGLRYYRWQGRDLPSVTSVRRMAGLPHGLHQWAISKVIDWTLDHLPTIVERVGAPDGAVQVKLLRTEMRGAATAERDAAANLGTAVHDAAAEGRSLADVPPAVAPRLRQYLDWLAVSGAEILGSEFQCWNLEVGYAGTADLLVRLRDGSIWLIDLKTGKGVYAEHALQLTAYARAEFVGEDDTVDVGLTELLAGARTLRPVLDVRTGAMAMTSGTAVLHLADDHWEFDVMPADEDAWVAFRGLAQFAVWMSEHAAVDTVIAARRRSSEAAA